jgi:hypothetical protein
LKALCNLAIGAQRLAAYANGLSHQADRSQADENPNHDCNPADFHFPSFDPEFPLGSPGSPSIPQISHPPPLK